MKPPASVQLRIDRLRLASRPRDGEARLREEIHHELERLFAEERPAEPVRPQARLTLAPGREAGVLGRASDAREVAQAIHNLWRSRK